MFHRGHLGIHRGSRVGFGLIDHAGVQKSATAAEQA
jgi:hypothetical protein